MTDDALRTAPEIERQRGEERAQPPTIVSYAPAPPVLPDAVTAVEAATLLGLNERTIRRAIERGDLAAIRRGRGFAIDPAALVRYRVAHAPAALRLPWEQPDAAAPDVTPPTLDADVDAPAAERRPRLGGLPSPLTAFVGREREAAALATLLETGSARLVTLTGPGGTGKTRLALEVAAAVAPRFGDGAAFVDLAPVRGAERVLPAILLAVGLREGDDRPPLERLVGHLRNHDALLVLDNLEHVLAAAPVLADLLVACPRLVILATSRSPLRLSGEHLVPVPPLALPAAGAAPSDAAATEAVRLFADRARLADPGFVLTEANTPVVGAICRRLDGLPLAIELAAARSAVLPPDALLDRLERRLPLLTGGPRDHPDRLRTMRGAIAWSEDLLDPAAQALLRRLSVFVGGIPLDAAEAVAAEHTTPGGAPAAGSPDVLDGLAALLDGGLLRREAEGGKPRFGMLETVREYALDRLAAAGEIEDARRAHAAWCLGFVEAAQPALWAAADGALLDGIEAEHDNLRAALGWTLTADPAAALRLASGLAPFWMRRSHWAEGRSWLERALATDADPDGPVRAFALGRLGAIAGDQGDFEVARTMFRQSLAMAERLGDARLVALDSRGLGIIASNQSDFEQAGTLFTTALDAFRALGDQPGVARCLNDLGLVAERQGDHGRAIAYQEEALPIARLLGDEHQVCVILGNLGGAYYDRGDYARGEALSEEALQVSRRIGDTFGEAVNLYNLGCSALRLGNAPVAAERYREVLGLSGVLGERHLISRVVDRVGAVLQLAGKPRQAVRFFGAAAAIREASGDTLFQDEDADLTARAVRARAALGEDAYTAAWESGHALPFAVAIEEAVRAAGSAAADRGVAVVDFGLTARESEVLRLLADGVTDREIADAIFVARATASKHVAAVIAKLGVESRTAAVAFALRHRLV